MKNLIWIILGIGIIGIIGLVIYSNQISCSGLNQAITVGIYPIDSITINDGKCCSGLMAKAPNGFTGGAWCVEPSDKVECLTGYEKCGEVKCIGINGEGIYNNHQDGTVTLLLNTQCPTPSLTEASCNSAGGQWNECGNRCEIENQGKTDIACPQVCESLCLCGGITGLDCPSGYICKTPSGMMDAMGYCKEIIA